LGDGGVLLHHDGDGKSHGRGETDQDHQHLFRLCDAGHAPLSPALPTE
jgi:hypothetical protein